MTNIIIDIATPTGKKESCEINILQDYPYVIKTNSQRFGLLSFTGTNLFTTLLQFRFVLEQEGCLLLCNAARRDAYPSGMCLDMGRGARLYVLKQREQTRLEDLINSLDPASIDQVGTVAEQRKNFENWLRSLEVPIHAIVRAMEIIEAREKTALQNSIETKNRE